METAGITSYEDVLQEWDEIQPPYAVCLETGDNVFYADGVAYYINPEFLISLYTDGKDTMIERKLEEILNNEGITYTKAKEYLTDIKLHETNYKGEVTQ